MRRTSLVAAVGAVALAGGGLALAAPASAGGGHGITQAGLHAHLDPLNNSGVTGSVHGRTYLHDGPRASLRLRATGAAPNLPHAQHIHFGEQARHECPTFRDDSNHDFRLNVAEGLPAYGPIAVSLTRRGDTSPLSALALDRMPVATSGGVIRYQRDGIRIFASPTQNARAVARAIANGKGVVVIHGIDYNQNGTYDLAGAGPSELDPTGATPAEATDPAACGVLKD